MLLSPTPWCRARRPPALMRATRRARPASTSGGSTGAAAGLPEAAAGDDHHQSQSPSARANGRPQKRHEEERPASVVSPSVARTAARLGGSGFSDSACEPSRGDFDLEHWARACRAFETAIRTRARTDVGALGAGEVAMSAGLSPAGCRRPTAGRGGWRAASSMRRWRRPTPGVRPPARARARGGIVFSHRPCPRGWPPTRPQGRRQTCGLGDVAGGEHCPGDAPGRG